MEAFKPVYIMPANILARAKVAPCLLFIAGSLLTAHSLASGRDQIVTIESAFAVADSRQQACDKALEAARYQAAQEAEVYVQSDLEIEARLDGGEYTETVRKYIKETTYGSVKVQDWDVLNTQYREEDGTIRCEVFAQFSIDTSDLKRLADLHLDTFKKREAFLNQITGLETELAENQQFYQQLQGRMAQFPTTMTGDYELECSTDTSIKQCRQLVRKLAEEDMQLELASYLEVEPQWVTSTLVDCQCQQQTRLINDETLLFMESGNYQVEHQLKDTFEQRNAQILTEISALKDAADQVQSAALSSATEPATASEPFATEPMADQPSEEPSSESWASLDHDHRGSRYEPSAPWEFPTFELGLNYQWDWNDRGDPGETGVYLGGFGLTLLINRSVGVTYFQRNQHVALIDATGKTRDNGLKTEVSGLEVFKRFGDGFFAFDLGLENYWPTSITSSDCTNCPSYSADNQFAVLGTVRTNSSGFNLGYRWRFHLDTPEDFNALSTSLFFEYIF